MKLFLTCNITGTIKNHFQWLEEVRNHDGLKNYIVFGDYRTVTSKHCVWHLQFSPFFCGLVQKSYGKYCPDYEQLYFTFSKFKFEAHKNSIFSFHTINIRHSFDQGIIKAFKSFCYEVTDKKSVQESSASSFVSFLAKSVSLLDSMYYSMPT